MALSRLKWSLWRTDNTSGARDKGARSNAALDELLALLDAGSAPGKVVSHYESLSTSDQARALRALFVGGHSDVFATVAATATVPLDRNAFYEGLATPQTELALSRAFDLLDGRTRKEVLKDLLQGGHRAIFELLAPLSAEPVPLASFLEGVARDKSPSFAASAFERLATADKPKALADLFARKDFALYAHCAPTTAYRILPLPSFSKGLGQGAAIELPTLQLAFSNLVDGDAPKARADLFASASFEAYAACAPSTSYRVLPLSAFWDGLQRGRPIEPWTVKHAFDNLEDADKAAALGMLFAAGGFEVYAACEGTTPYRVLDLDRFLKGLEKSLGSSEYAGAVRAAFANVHPSEQTAAYASIVSRGYEEVYGLAGSRASAGTTGGGTHRTGATSGAGGAWASGGANGASGGQRSGGGYGSWEAGASSGARGAPWNQAWAGAKGASGGQGPAGAKDAGDGQGPAGAKGAGGGEGSAGASGAGDRTGGARGDGYGSRSGGTWTAGEAAGAPAAPRAAELEWAKGVLGAVSRHPASEVRRAFEIAAPVARELLGVSSSDDAAEIRDAYRAMARKWHPDINKAAQAEERFKQIGWAFDVLSPKVAYSFTRSA